MKHSRVTKFKAYRDSFTKAGAQNIDGADDIISGLSKETDLGSTTNTLPFKDVIHEVGLREEEERRLKQAVTKRAILTVLACVGVLLLIGLTVYFGILAFGGK